MRTHLLELARASRQEVQNVSYVVTNSLEDDAEFVIFESYRSLEGFAHHRESQHFQEIGLDRILPDLAHRSTSSVFGSVEPV